KQALGQMDKLATPIAKQAHGAVWKMHGGKGYGSVYQVLDGLAAGNKSNVSRAGKPLADAVFSKNTQPSHTAKMHRKRHFTQAWNAYVFNRFQPPAVKFDADIGWCTAFEQRLGLTDSGVTFESRNTGT